MSFLVAWKLVSKKSFFFHFSSYTFCLYFFNYSLILLAGSVPGVKMFVAQFCELSRLTLVSRKLRCFQFFYTGLIHIFKAGFLSKNCNE